MARLSALRNFRGTNGGEKSEREEGDGYEGESKGRDE